ncbi:MAG TPA: bifunctional homocysteine S-methyltransferase/methylenetetrahydrofolate reductase [Streptosporangiaceae bacterium]|nr:bifunctional homocysteine S-methyltransferase/methylenetetrahydrofolate reductase [Streptosporangiaceae bacterium]
MTDLVTSLGQRILICDGAMGTMLHAAGNSLDRALPELNLSNAELVSTIHESYLSAGADMILTNTFGANRLRLADQGFGEMVREINIAGARIAARARERAGRQVFVAGSISPAVTASQRRRVAREQRVEAIREQVEALAEGGVDALILETFGYLDELAEAVTVAAELSSLPIIAQATFASDGRTLGGESPREVASALSGLPIVVLGTNCTLGPQGLLAVIEALVPHTSLPVSAQPNAGLPRRVAGRRFEYNVDGAYFARYARRLVEAGAALVGGCCGTTPAQIQAAAREISGMSPADARPTTTQMRRPGPPVALPAQGGGLSERLASREFVVAAGIAPPLGGTADEAADQAAALRERGIDIFFIESRQSPRAQLSSIDLAFQLQQRADVETIATVTTWDKTIMALQADLLGANALGIRNVVCETGNPPLLGDYPNVDGIWDVDSVGLVELIAGLNQGTDCNGLALATKTSFHCGARFNPSAAALDAEISRTASKIRAGAKFLISRPVYELGLLRRMVAALAEEDIPILLSIVPLRSFEEADYLSHEVPDISIPRQTLTAMERAGPHAVQTGLELAADLLAEARPLVQGVVLTFPGWDPPALDHLLGAPA